MANERIHKINAEMQTIISQVIRTLKDPRLENALISILKVDTSGDLSHAKVYTSIYNVADSKETFKAILNSVPYIRRQVAGKIKLRIMPELHFTLDDSMEYAEKIDNLINKIHKK